MLIINLLNHMKRHIFTLLLLVAGLQAAAQNNGDQLFRQGSQAYAKGDYATAITKWQSILDDGQESGALLYNMGNAYYRQEDYAHAVLFYERAHRLMPRDRDTRENLALAYSKTEDHIQQAPSLFIVTWWRALLSLFSPRGWMWACLLVAALAGTALALFLLSRSMAWRKGSFIAAIVLGACLLLVVAMAATSAHNATHRQEAIVTAPMTVVKSSPDQDGLDKFVLHEGTHLRLSDTEEHWTKVFIDDGNSGWLPNSDFETI